MKAEVIRAKPEPKKPEFRTAVMPSTGTKYRYNTDMQRFEFCSNGVWRVSAWPASPRDWEWEGNNFTSHAFLLDLMMNPVEPQEEQDAEECEITEVVLRMNREEAESLAKIAWKSDIRGSYDFFYAIPVEIRKGASKKWGSCG